MYVLCVLEILEDYGHMPVAIKEYFRRVARLDSTFDVPSHVAPAVGCHDHDVSSRSELRLSERLVPRIKRQRFGFGLPQFQPAKT